MQLAPTMCTLQPSQAIARRGPFWGLRAGAKLPELGAVSSVPPPLIGRCDRFTLQLHASSLWQCYSAPNSGILGSKMAAGLASIWPLPRSTWASKMQESGSV